MRGMNFLLAVVAYLIIGAVLGAGLLMTMKGSPWLLVIGLLAYVVIFARIGCLPKKSH
jgi:hypothetical protein